MTALWTILAVISFCLLIFGAKSAIENDNVQLTLIILFVFSIATAICVVEANRAYENKPKDPTALDVYRGKTELVITYRGTEPIDTIVVFKKK